MKPELPPKYTNIFCLSPCVFHHANITFCLHSPSNAAFLPTAAVRRRSENAMKLKCCISVRCIMINTLSLFYVKSQNLTCGTAPIHSAPFLLYLTVIDVDYVRHLLYDYLSLNMPRPPPSSFDKCFPSEFTSSPPYKKFRGFLPKAIAPGSNLIMNTTTVYTLPAFVPVI